MPFYSPRSLALVRWGSALALAGSLTVGTLPAAAQSASSSCTNVFLELNNPNPGDNLRPGNYRIDGTAFDVTAPQGTGINRVAVFLDTRESGGTDLGNATLGQSATVPVPNSQFSNAGFTIIAGLPTNNGGPHTLYVYAYSNSGAMATAAVPIIVNGSNSISGATAAPQPQLCSASAPAGQSAGSSSTPTGSGSSAQASGSSASAPASTMVLQLANPSPGATILHGNYQLQGLAYDRAASSGTGVDTVTVFLDSRESGGLNLGTATLGQAGTNSFSLVVGLPGNSLGAHNLVVYAHSTVTGQETVLTVPVTIQ